MLFAFIFAIVFSMARLSQKKIKELKAYFQSRSDIAMAFLFGSSAKGWAVAWSDVDIAVYFFPKDKVLEWEEEKEWPQEQEIWVDTEKIVKKNVDLIVLNRIPSRIAYNILQTGIPLDIKSRLLYLRFLTVISSAAIEFQEIAEDYRKIKERSRSLSSEDRQRLQDLLGYLQEEMKSYDEFRNLTQHDYQAQRIQKRNVEHWVESMVLISIDIAKILLASQKMPLPSTYREMLAQLSNVTEFEATIADSLSRFAKLRNVITHEYLDLRWKQIRDFTTTSQPLYEYLVDFINTKILR